MGRTAKDRRRYAPKPVEKAALSEKHTGLRLAAVILLLAGGAAALSYALTALLTPQSGWQQVEVKASAGTESAAACLQRRLRNSLPAF